MSRHAFSPRFVVIDGKRHLWRRILELRREQLTQCREARQPLLFPMIEDARPKAARSAAGRYSEPTLFDC